MGDFAGGGDGVHGGARARAEILRGAARAAASRASRGGELAAAAEDYLEAVRLEPKNAEANLRLGLVLVTMKKTALGRRYLERTVELDPSGETGAKARLLLETTPALEGQTPGSRRSKVATGVARLRPISLSE